MDDVRHRIPESLASEDGQGATEYGLVVALVLLSLAGTITILATSITTFLNGVAGVFGGLLP